MSAWCLCVWRFGRGAKELADASLPELLASGGSVCGQPAVDWAAATVATPLLRTTDPRLCWVSFPSHKVRAASAAERSHPRSADALGRYVSASSDLCPCSDSLSAWRVAAREYPHTAPEMDSIDAAGAADQDLHRLLL